VGRNQNDPGDDEGRSRSGVSTFSRKKVIEQNTPFSMQRAIK